MMGTLAASLAGKKIKTFEDVYRADVEGDIENVNGVLKITTIRVKYHLKVNPDQKDAAREAFGTYLSGCPAAQSVMGCIKIEDLPQDRMIDRWMSLAPFFKCRECGKGFGSVRQLDLLKTRQPRIKSYLELCPECRGKSLGRALLVPTGAHNQMRI